LLISLSPILFPYSLIHQPIHPQSRTNHTRCDNGDFAREYFESGSGFQDDGFLFTELFHAGVVGVGAEADEGGGACKVIVSDGNCA
ncbi:UNVERIFIED_CONTAM: hypothetical protein NY603_20330, partial [Bacteroidetes bacterium 56_B9]